MNDPLYNHTVFGPEKGKGGNIGKSDEKLIADLISIHNAENWLGMDGAGDSETSLFKADSPGGSDSSGGGGSGGGGGSDSPPVLMRPNGGTKESKWLLCRQKCCQYLLSIGMMPPAATANDIMD